MKKVIILSSRFAEEDCVKLIPELEVDYTPVLIIPYENLPDDLKLWEKEESWLLDEKTKIKIKEGKAAMVAKSMEKDATRASMMWRLSLNPAPVMQKIFDHLGSKCNAKKILRLIKDIKNAALIGNEKDFLKSYNVKQAMIWSIHQNPNICSEKDLLMATLSQMLDSYQRKILPSFLEPQRNLIYKMANNEKLEMAKRRIIDIMSNIESYIGKIKAGQRRNRKGIMDVQQLIKPMASFLLLPIISDNISETTTTVITAKFTTSDGVQRSYFDERVRTEIIEIAKHSTKVVSEREALKFFSKQWVDSIMKYLMETEDDTCNPEEKSLVPRPATTTVTEPSNSPQLSRVARRNIAILDTIGSLVRTFASNK